MCKHALSEDYKTNGGQNIDQNFGFPINGRYRYLVTEKNELIATIDVDYKNRQLLDVKNHSALWFKLPFGQNANPTFEDFCYFMRTRVVQASYGGLQELYETFKPEVRDLYHLLLAMHGRVVTDHLEIKEEKL